MICGLLERTFCHAIAIAAQEKESRDASVPTTVRPPSQLISWTASRNFSFGTNATEPILRYSKVKKGNTNPLARALANL
jgi:hypothetical protein